MWHCIRLGSFHCCMMGFSWRHRWTHQIRSLCSGTRYRPDVYSDYYKPSILGKKPEDNRTITRQPIEKKYTEKAIAWQLRLTGECHFMWTDKTWTNPTKSWHLWSAATCLKHPVLSCNYYLVFIVLHKLTICIDIDKNISTTTSLCWPVLKIELEYTSIPSMITQRHTRWIALLFQR